MKRENNKEEVREFIENGGRCFYRYGYGWKGAEKREIPMEKALSLLPSYSFGMGFYELIWAKVDGEDAIIFNEYSENDLY